jgi:hypothetical protein
LATLAPDSEEAKRIDAALAEWRQGDLALDERWFIHVGDPAMPLSEAAGLAEENGLQALMSEVAGLVVVTQTCDIVRSCAVRPYVEVAPLMRVSEEELHDVQRGRRPSHVTLPGLSKGCLVADLDRVMTVEKSIVANWTRTPGYTHDADGRAFALALSRKRIRFAFPDDFTVLAKKLQSRLVSKHSKGTDEGRALRSLREIRVHAIPAWDAHEVEIFLWFIRGSGEANFEGKNWADLLSAWLKLVATSGRFLSVHGQVVALEDMTAAEYVDSDPLDLDHLSSAETYR